MSDNFVAPRKVMGGHMMKTTLMPKLVYGTQIGLYFDGFDEFPERITATTPVCLAFLQV